MLSATIKNCFLIIIFFFVSFLDAKLEVSPDFVQVGEASWYGPGFQGRKTANGERFNTHEMTAAHKTLPFNTLIKVTNLHNEATVVVRINDRGPFIRGRIIDLSKAAKEEIGMGGLAQVKLEVYDPEAEEQIEKEQDISEMLMPEIISYLGTPYKYGGVTKNGIDCSAFVQNTFFFALDIALPRTSIQQSTIGITIIRDSLKFGDLIFFHTRGRRKISHVGIYLDENKFVHSSRSGGVKISDLNENFYSKAFVLAKRILN